MGPSQKQAENTPVQEEKPSEEEEEMAQKRQSFVKVVIPKPSNLFGQESTPPADRPSFFNSKITSNPLLPLFTPTPPPERRDNSNGVRTRSAVLKLKPKIVPAPVPSSSSSSAVFTHSNGKTEHPSSGDQQYNEYEDHQTNGHASSSAFVDGDANGSASYYSGQEGAEAYDEYSEAGSYEGEGGEYNENYEYNEGQQEGEWNEGQNETEAYEEYNEESSYDQSAEAGEYSGEYDVSQSSDQTSSVNATQGELAYAYDDPDDGTHFEAPLKCVILQTIGDGWSRCLFDFSQKVYFIPSSHLTDFGVSVVINES